MAWRKIIGGGADHAACTVAQDWPAACADPQHKVDPYLVWSDLTGFLWTLAPQQDWLPFLIEVRTDTWAFIDQVAQQIPECNGHVTQILQVPAAYKRRLRPQGQCSRFFTALVRRGFVRKVAALPDVVRMKLGLARGEGVDSTTDRQPAGASPRLQLLQGPSTWPPGYSDSEYRAQPDAAANAKTLVLGVIDDGCNFAHPAYRHGASSRVVRLWDQNENAPEWSGKPRYFGYGRVLAEAEIARALAPRRPEREVYEEVYGPVPGAAPARRHAPLLKGSSTHGTSVLQLLAGVHAPLPQLPGEPASGAARGADSADVVFVQLPGATATDTSSSSLCVHALDAIRYIIDRAETYAPLPPQAPGEAEQERVMRKVVINLSYGSMSGPHDGTAVLDEAIDELVQTRGDLAVVVAAGNSRRSRCHAQMVLGPGELRSVGWSVAPADTGPSVLEIWLEGEGADVQLTAPNGDVSSWVSAGEVHALRCGGEDAAWIVAPAGNAVGKNGRLVLLALAPTSERCSHGRCAPHGLWKVSLRSGASQASAPVEANLWVERNDLVGERLRRQQAFLVPWDAQTQVSTSGTLCSPATAKAAVAVGASVWSTRDAAPYSGQGWERGKKNPDAMAEVDLSSCLGGLRVAGTVSGATVRVSGTSAAAPIVARRLADWMATQPQRLAWADIRAQLAQAGNAPLDGTAPSP